VAEIKIDATWNPNLLKNQRLMRGQALQSRHNHTFGAILNQPFKMNKEQIVKLTLLLAFLLLFLFGSRFGSEHSKVQCSEEKCELPHEHGELNFHERFHAEPGDKIGVAVLKSSANFWEANATGMTFALIIGGAALSLLLSWKKFERTMTLTGVKGAAFGSLLGMPLNMCANCSAVTGAGMTSQGGSAEALLGVTLGGALFNFIGIATMFSLFSPAVGISRIVFSLLMILGVVPFVSKWMKLPEAAPVRSGLQDWIGCYFPEKSWRETVVKAFENWLISVGNIAWKLIPLMLLGTLLTAIFRVAFPNEALQQFAGMNQLVVIAAISFVGTMLSIPVLFEILLGVLLLNLGFDNGAIAAMVFAAPSFGLFTVVLTRHKFGGLKIPFLLLAITFVFGIGAGLLADFLTPYF
jgi:uncharacterized membrane protein YraQ (UPF0718 family)